MESILSAAERLVDFPESGRIVPEFGMVNLREVIHPPFRIVYRVERNRVRIVRVWRSERLRKVKGDSGIPCRFTNMSVRPVVIASSGS